MICERVDELAAAYALGAVEADEERAVSEHLATCDRAHAEARELIGVAAALPAGLEPVTPSPALRDRLMATVAVTPQDHAPAAVQPLRSADAAVEAPRRPWWRLHPLPAAVAAVGLAAVVGLGAWNLELNGQLAKRDDALRMVATADAAFAVTGSAGSGWVLESGDEAIFVADSLAELPEDQIYELWLIEPDGAPIAVGTLTDTDGVAVVPLDRELGDATAFAVTVEAERVDAPTTDPVLVAPLSS